MTESAAAARPSEGPAGDRSPRSVGVTPARAPLSDRVLGALAGVGSLALLVVAGALSPSAAGHGTHEQLGLPACPWAESLGFPCATCGWTTAFSLAADGRLVDAARAQPFGAILALLTAGTVWGGLLIAATGSRLASAAGTMLLTPRALAIWTVALGLSWAYKAAVW